MMSAIRQQMRTTSRGDESLLWSLPSGYSRPMGKETPASGEWIRLVTGDVHSLCRPGLEAAIAETYSQHRWIYDALIGRSDSTVFRGRHPVVGGVLADQRVVIKRMYHGGVLARIGGDAFLTSARARAHVELAGYLAAHGVATPPVVFVSWRRMNGFIRSEIGFERIYGAIDADELFFGERRAPEGWEGRAAAIGALLARLHQIRFLHADVNLMNFLFAGDGKTYVLDLDKTTLRRRALSPGERNRNLERLERSIRKQGRNHDPAVAEGIIREIRSAYRRTLNASSDAAGLELLMSSSLSKEIERLPPV
ncbi:MAG TPA: lipopolysaccharide kinase InaA family protein [Thermoanaerobaculia bacterium]|nr:lipopolysaccharide kinase InaA family protein [Thermoanaerobaculia bacterium]